MDIGIVVLKRTRDGLELIDLHDFQMVRQQELELTLEPGSYIILPRTSGCTLRRPEEAVDENISLLEKDLVTSPPCYFLHPLFEATIEDIFSKFDMSMNGVLGFQEFKGFMQVIGKADRFELIDFQRNVL